ncbi:phosphatidylinositide phosphatase SAC2 isoform X2 [Anoplophora glabripennis]|uniref:phosphatidylinositide phosphatase SAC2 isoform X2 n=1 Tax=Anoplophora glabripennis TaxID=217634 RepID=UPI0008740AD4|nr:phosphatidylinositide phosphatase SAC2 isoform X2 [Anoplophora glabripennis]
MELFRTNDFYIFVNGEYSLWWDRQTGAFIPKTEWDLTDADDPVCLGLCDGIIGKVEHVPLFDPRLLLIKESLPVGKLHGDHEVYKIKSVVFLPLSLENVEINLLPCRKHKALNIKPNTNTSSLFDIQKNTAFTKTWGTLKNAGNTIKNTTQQAAAMATGVQKKSNIKDKERFEKQIVEEFYKIFNETNSFYYSRTTDLTNSLQRLCNLEKHNVIDPQALWKTVDDRFFWNKHMLKSIVDSENPLCNPWILPIIQGYIQIEDCKVEMGRDLGDLSEGYYEIFTLCILSRRSRFRAGTRYKRRGVDENGEVANYVETEQIVSYQSHEVSFVQVRGSVPVYWSQPGFKYRPPPRIDKGETETKAAFEKHFNKEVQKYGPMCIINLIEQSGKEKVIFDAYSHQVLQYNSPFLTYVTFDFHEYCRGMHFENVSILINAVSDIIKDMNYCWRDKQGHICSQNGVFRVNCIDCLDRTNVVQTALGKAVMEIQFCKLGLVSPEGSMPTNIRNTFQLLWANNGDIISKQYAGTNALKGDYTRTGERKFTGIMKDGMNSANRYYLSRFKDSTRQGTIDMMLGNYVSEDEFNESKASQYEEDSIATAEHVKLLIEDCKKMLINQPEQVVGAWGLINADPSTGDPNETEMDSILILTKDSYFIADYDDQFDKVTKYQRVYLQDLTLFEFGMAESTNSLFKSSKPKYCIRLNYKVNNVSGYYHMFRSTNLRFFNNMAVVIKNIDEEVESLKAICEAFVVAMDIAGISPVPFKQGLALDRRKSKVINSGTSTTSSIYLDIASLPQMTRNVSESQLLSLKNVGTKALSNMTQQFSKLNKISHSFKQNKSMQKPNFSIGQQRKNESSSDSDEDYENSIFQPNESIQDRTSLQYATDSSCDRSNNSIEQGLEVTEDSFIPPTNKDTFLPGVGIVMGNKNEIHDIEGVLEQKQNLLSRVDSSQMDDVQLSSIMQNVSINGGKNSNPEIQINSDELDVSKKIPPNTLKLEKKFSHSSGNVNDSKDASEFRPSDTKLERSSSDYEVQLNISQSQSESALKSKLGGIGTPVASATKDLVLSPFSKLAKGMQQFGVNLDPRKLSGHTQVRHVTEREMEEHRKLQERWQNSKTRLIAL